MLSTAIILIIFCMHMSLMTIFHFCSLYTCNISIDNKTDASLTINSMTIFLALILLKTNRFNECIYYIFSIIILISGIVGLMVSVYHPLYMETEVIIIALICTSFTFLYSIIRNVYNIIDNRNRDCARTSIENHNNQNEQTNLLIDLDN